MRYIAVAAASAIVWLTWMGWPQPADTGLDALWQLVLGYARAQRWQFGTHFVFTHGPWSFLNVVHSHAATFWAELAWQIFFKGVLAAIVGLVSAKLPAWRAILLLLGAALLFPSFEDVGPVLLILFFFSQHATSKRRIDWITSSAAALLAFIALQKFTYCVMIAAGATGSTAVLLLARQPRRALVFGLTLIGCICLFWVLAEQRITGLPVFLQRSWHLASLYSETMFYDEASSVFWCGILTLIAAALEIVMAVNRCESKPLTVRAALALLGFGFAFLTWKQGFVRADGHVAGFFLCALGVGLVLRPAWSGLTLSSVALLGFTVSSSAFVIAAPELFGLRVANSVRALSSPAALHARFERDTAAATERASLPKIRERVGHNAVDVFGDDHAVVLLNALVYQPRPVFQTHQTYSPALAELNASFYAGATAPEYVLMRPQTIDGPFPPRGRRARPADPPAASPRCARGKWMVVTATARAAAQRIIHARPVASHPVR